MGKFSSRVGEAQWGKDNRSEEAIDSQTLALADSIKLINQAEVGRMVNS